MDIKYHESLLESYSENEIYLLAGYIPLNKGYVYYKRKIHKTEVIKLGNHILKVVLTPMEYPLPDKEYRDSIIEEILTELLDRYTYSIDRYRLDGTKLKSREFTLDDVDILDELINGYKYDYDDDVLYVYRNVNVKSNIALGEVISSSRGKWVKEFRDNVGISKSKNIPTWLTDVK